MPHTHLAETPAAHHPTAERRRPKRKVRAPKAAGLARLSAQVAELREVLGPDASVVWLPEMSAKEKAAWEKSVQAREEAGRVDWTVKELRAIREGRV